VFLIRHNRRRLQGTALLCHPFLPRAGLRARPRLIPDTYNLGAHSGSNAGDRHPDLAHSLGIGTQTSRTAWGWSLWLRATRYMADQIEDPVPQPRRLSDRSDPVTGSTQEQEAQHVLHSADRLGPENESEDAQERRRQRKWKTVTSAGVVKVPAPALGSLLSSPKTWKAIFSGSAETSVNPQGIPIALEESRIVLRTDFAEVALGLSHTGVSFAETPEGPPRRLVYLRSEEVAIGPVEALEIRSLVEPVDTSRSRLSIDICWRGDVPYFWAIFRPLFRSYFARLARRLLQRIRAIAENGEPSSATASSERPLLGRPWWAPPDRLTVYQTKALASLCMYALVMGYMTSLTGIAQHQIIETFHADDAALGRMLFALGLGSVPGVLLLPLGDRVGRRRILVPTLYLTAVATALSALTPNLVAFTALQTLVRAPLFVALSLAWIYLVEEMPVRARAYAISLFTMTGGLGGGFGLFGLPAVQHLSPSGWRLLFAAGIFAIFFAIPLARDLPETKRFVRAWHGANPSYLLKRPHFGRIAILVLAALASSIYGSPAARYQGRYIQNALGYSPGAYVAFTVVTTLPAAPGMLLGGRLADIWGRKVVGILAASVGAISQALLYWLSGPLLWISSSIGSFVGAMWIPALGSFSTELFPTSLRANASSVTSTAGMIGGAAGSWVAGSLVVAFGGYGPAVTALLPAALVSGLLMLLLFPETKGKELEEISPELVGPADTARDLPAFGGPSGLFR
jgi:MFS family permease